MMLPTKDRHKVIAKLTDFMIAELTKKELHRLVHNMVYKQLLEESDESLEEALKDYIN